MEKHNLDQARFPEIKASSMHTFTTSQRTSIANSAVEAFNNRIELIKIKPASKTCICFLQKRLF